MSSAEGYHLVHLLSNGEFMAPLIATQVFDRAQAQATTPGKDKPLSVSVWIVEPMKYVFDKAKQNYLAKLRARCPDVKIKLIGGLSRLKTWPAMQLLGIERRKLGSAAVVYHCRGEDTFQWGYKLASRFRKDATVLDIRGFWPLERLAQQDVFDIHQLSERQNAEFKTDVQNLSAAISRSNMVTTVSEPLKQYLVQNYNAPGNTCVVPCCVNNIINNSSRKEIRTRLAIGDRKALLYLGGTQKYQHLEDLVFPFFRSALAQSDDSIAVFITQDKKTMQQIADKFQLPSERVRIISVSQGEVGDYLPAMDAGLLLRAPSTLNNFSQPVKLGEYLAAGLPVIVEKGTGNVVEMLSAFDIAFGVSLHGAPGEGLNIEVGKALRWVENSGESRRETARQFVEQHYTWKANVQKERKMYMESLAGKLAKTSKTTV